MSTDGRRYIFAGHAIGAQAHFHKLDDVMNLDHHIPTLGASVLPPTGGLSTSKVNNYCYQVSHPRRRTLLSVHRIETMARGKQKGDVLETETEAEIESIDVLEKVHIDLVHVHVLATRKSLDDDAVITTKGLNIQGVHLGPVEVRVTLKDEEVFCCCGNARQVEKFFKERNLSLASPVGHPIKQYHIVKSIEIVAGPEDQRADIDIHDNVIHWRGFGRMHFGEVIVKDQDRQVTMVRLQMGSDGGGSGSVGDGHSNGSTGSN